MFKSGTSFKTLYSSYYQKKYPLGALTFKGVTCMCALKTPPFRPSFCSGDPPF